MKTMLACALLTFYKVAHGIACKMSHIITELILLTVVDMVSVMISEFASQVFSQIPLFINTICRRIQHLANHFNDKLTKDVKEINLGCSWMMATYGNNHAHMIAYMRFIDGNNIVEDTLFFIY